MTIKIYKKQGHTLRSIAEVIDCSPSTIMYELRRGTGQRSGSRGWFPKYSAKRGQAHYEMNRSRCHRKAKALNGTPFADWIADNMIKPKCVSIERNSAEQILCFADEMNALPRKQLGYRTPDDLFDEFPNKVYALNSTRVA